MNSVDFYKLMLVTHRQNNSLSKYLDFIKQCVSSGITSVQFREKNTDKAFKLLFAQSLKDILTPYNIPLIINDDVILAAQINAAGVHLGQEDELPQLAREQLCLHQYIGLSIETKQQLDKANYLPLNYVAASAVFPSKHKNNLRTIWGLEGLNQLCQESKHPVIGIGGINLFNIGEVIQAGARGVAVIGAIHQAENPAKAALKLRELIDKES